MIHRRPARTRIVRSRTILALTALLAAMTLAGCVFAPGRDGYREGYAHGGPGDYGGGHDQGGHDQGGHYPGGHDQGGHDQGGH